MSMFDQIMDSINESLVSETAGTAVEFDEAIAGITYENAEVLPEDTNEIEYLMRAANESDLFMARMNTAIIAEEYNYYKNNGTTYVWEAEGEDGKSGISSIVERFVGFVKRLWNKIAAAFKSFFAKLDIAASSDAKIVEKYRPIVSGKKVKLNGYSPDLLNADGIAKQIKKIYDGVEDSMDKINKLKDKKLLKQTDGTNPVKAAGKEYESAQQQVELVKQNWADKAEHEYTGDQAIAYLATIKDKKDDLKKAHDNAKKACDDVIKTVKDAAKKVKADKGEKVEKADSAVNAVTNASQKLLNIVASASSLTFTMTMKGRNLAKAIVKAIAAQSAKDTVTSESTVEINNTVDNRSIFDRYMDATE